MFVVECLCCIRRGLCVGLILRPEEFYRVWYVSFIVIGLNNKPLHLQRVRGRNQNKKERRGFLY